MMLAYASFAVVLLAYVSTQVYTSSLMEDIAELKRTRRDSKEEIGLLMAEYMSLSSKRRIANYCEKKLGMVPAGSERMHRVSVNARNWIFAEPQEFTNGSIRIPSVMGQNLSGITEVIRR